MERTVFAECGSWKNFEDLEDSLTLEELSELYEESKDQQFFLIKSIAAMWGGEVEDGGTVEDGWEPVRRDHSIIGSSDAAAMPIGLGYETR